MNSKKHSITSSSVVLCLFAVISLVSPVVALTGKTKPQTVKSSPKRQAKMQVEGRALNATQLSQARLANVPESEWSEWYEPRVIESGSRRLDFDLNVQMAENIVKVKTREGKLRDQRVNLRSYNGALASPTIKLKPGDTWFLTMNNNLPRETDLPNCAHDEHAGEHVNDPTKFCLNTTNIHTHGLHISPNIPLGEPGRWSDNVFRSIAPTKNEKYAFQILPAGNPEPEKPAIHYPGSFWYHAHQHGSTSVQLASGMAGALIVKGNIDEHPGIKGANDRVFIFQQLAFDAEGEIKRRTNNRDIVSVMRQNWQGAIDGQPADAITGPPKNTTINGRLLPKIELRPGQVERWRFFDAGLFEMLDIWLGNPEINLSVPFHQIAFDGITLPKVNMVPGVSMGPGYRTDVMVQAPRNVPREGLILYLYKSPTRFTFDSTQQAAAQILAVVEVKGTPCNQAPDCHSALPNPQRPLPAPKDMLPDITRDDLPKKIVTFSGTGPFLVDGKLYNPSELLPQFRLKKGDTEEWHITNKSAVAHPFHIHVNAFQMLDDKGKPAEWRDTIIVPPNKTVKFRTRYERFSGDFVLHCHILFHEDLGMMQRVKIEEK
jgi:FtsP/CotA-like multicopper oxidase with cupredoxin domain